MSETFNATVLLSMPTLGAAILQSNEETVSNTKYMIGYARSGSLNGAVEHAVPPAGTHVLCSSLFMNMNGYVLCEIIGEAAGKRDRQSRPGRQDSVYRFDDYTASKSEAMLKAFEKLLPHSIQKWLRNNAHGAPVDSYPGDWDIMDVNGQAGLHVGRNIAQLRGSPTAFVDVNSFYNMVRTVAECIEQHTPTSEDVVDRDYRVSNIAACPSEGFGFRKDKPAFRKDDKREVLELEDKGTIPFYRTQRMEGVAVGGTQESSLALPQGKEKHTVEDEPHVLAARRQSMSGMLTDGSAYGLASVKSPFIPAIHQAIYGGGKATELRQKGDPKVEESKNLKELKEKEGTEEYIRDTALNKLLDTVLSDDYVDKFIKRLAERGFSISSPDAAPNRNPQEKEWPAGKCEKDGYKPPEYVEVENPATGEKIRYYNTMSFITQEPDGSICICDGYGSEIRMSRGNIYISPALDLFLRPGRNLQAMTPGHQSFNSQKTCTLNSSQGTYVRAKGDLRMAGGTGGSGVVVLESKSINGVDASLAGKGLDVNPGLVIRSLGGLSATAATNLYIGRNDHKGTDKNKLTSPKSEGSIVLDAGDNGAVYAKGMACTIDARESVLGSFTGSAGNSALVVQANSIGVMSPNIIMPGNILAHPIEKAPSVSVFSDGKVEKQVLSTAPSCSLQVSAGMRIGGSLEVNDTVLMNGTLAARTILSSTSRVSAVKDPDKVFHKFTPKAAKVPDNYGGAASEAAAKATKDVAQDRFINGCEFRFPPDYGVADSLVVPGMVWQARATESGKAGKKWREEYITTIDGEETAAFPGKDVWEKAKVSARMFKEKPNLKDDYVTNAE